MTEKTQGRPTKYKEEYNEQARKLCLLGSTDKQLANFFEVNEQTINNWKEEFPEFLGSIREGKDIADANVGSRLYERAMGYSHPEEKVFNNGGEIITHEGTKHYPPDATSMIFWLKNRQRDKWRDKHDVEHTGGITFVDDFGKDADDQV